ncbi:MAG: sulfatase [Planctomycetota bacterium]
MKSERRRARTVRGRALALVAAAAIGSILAGCGDEPGAASTTDGVVLLTRGFEPTLPPLPVEVGRGENHVVRLVSVDGRPWVEVEYGRGAWTPGPFDGSWLADRHEPPSTVTGAADSTRTTIVDGVEARRVENPVAVEVPPPDSYREIGHVLCVHPGPGAAAPENVVVRVPFPIGEPDGEGWRVTTHRWSGEGFALLPGVPQTVTIPEDGPRRLRFSYFATTNYGDREGTPRFSVEVDGRATWSSEVENSASAAVGVLRTAEIELPAGARRARFAVEGPVGLYGVLAPRLVPGGREAHETLDGRPNLVLFVADTLRADALTTYRRLADSPEVDFPHLEALAARGTTFERTWSTTTWTLPSHASMFTSLLPRQHGADDVDRRLVANATTLAEVLRAAGYRTVAVTDGVYLSIEYGLDQGFEQFDEAPPGAHGVLERANDVLADHDGRPTFLFVHTYAAHTPYLPTDAARERVGLDMGTRFEDAYAAVDAAVLANPGADDYRDAPGIDGLRRFYWGAVADLDTAFGDWFERFEHFGWDTNVALAFTSDHGEAFGDHAQFFHGGMLVESLVRVPLVLVGDGWGAGERRSDVASLVDLAPTLVAAAGARAPDAWRGRSLRREANDALAWMSNHIEGTKIGEQHAVTDGSTKLVDEPRIANRYAYDLVRDPDELHRLDAPRRLADAFEADRDEILRYRLVGDPTKSIGADLRKDLEAMGYLQKE